MRRTIPFALPENRSATALAALTGHRGPEGQGRLGGRMRKGRLETIDIRDGQFRYKCFNPTAFSVGIMPITIWNLMSTVLFV